MGAFTDSVRWGVSLKEVLEAVAAEDQSRRGLNPALRQMGFLGLIESGNTIAVLIASPGPDGGGIIQLAPGDSLPDGRILASVTDNSITLAGNPDSPDAAAGVSDREVLLLFPRGDQDLATRSGH